MATDAEDDEREDAKTGEREDAKADDANEDDAKAAGEGQAADEDEKPAPRKRAQKAAGSASRAARKAEAGKAEARKPSAGRPRRRKGGKDNGEDAGADVDSTYAVGAAAAPVVTVAQERAARRALLAGGLLSTVGLALVGTGPSEAGTALCIAGLLALIYGIHTFGRLGPEPAK